MVNYSGQFVPKMLMLKTTSNYYKDEWSVQCVFFFLSFLIVNAQRKKYTLAFMGKKNYIAMHAWARRYVQAQKINQNSMLHIQSYVFGIKDFEFDTFRNLRQRTRRVGTRLGA